MRIVTALGGNALLRRGQPLTAENQRANVRVACEQLARIMPEHEVVIAHGNGPQVGLLALQGAAYEEVEPYPLDVLGAQTEGMIGYVIEQELGNLLPAEASFATVLTQVEVDADDPAFKHPSKPIGPVYTREQADHMATDKGWAIAADGDMFRRVVASPRPQRVFEIRPIKWLLEKGCVVICAGGGGIPTVYDDNGQLLTASYNDYTMPRADDMPNFTVDHQITACTHNPLGVKGCGEAGAIGSPPAVINAIVDALQHLGVDHMEMPATPRKVWRAIHEAKN